jgi:hypothetical protein
MESKSNDRGQTTVLGVFLLGLAALLMIGLVAMGATLRDRAQARNAADAAALAGAAEGKGSATEIAAANGGRLTRYGSRGREVIVAVAVGRVDAYARARQRPPVVVARSPIGVPGGEGPHVGTGVRAGLAPEMLAALSRADALLGRPVPIASGLRSRAQQQALWDRRAQNPYPVARPGTSHHEQGRAVDVPRGFVPQLLTVAAAAGLCQPMPQSDPVHFEVCR